jgi:hypothetical protein
MMNQKQLLAVLGFAFTAAWIGFNFGYAVLCLVGAALFYAAGSVAEGELDLPEIQDRLRGGGGQGSSRVADRGRTGAQAPRVR